MGDRPSVREAVKLASFGVYLTANPLDSLWDGARDFHVGVFQPNGDNERILLPVRSGTWWPKYPKDWKNHPRVCRVLEFIRYYPVGKRMGFDLGVQPVAPGRYCMVLPPQWEGLILSGKKSAADLYAWLVSTHPHME